MTYIVFGGTLSLPQSINLQYKVSTTKRTADVDTSLMERLTFISHSHEQTRICMMLRRVQRLQSSLHRGFAITAEFHLTDRHHNNRSALSLSTTQRTVGMRTDRVQVTPTHFLRIVSSSSDYFSHLPRNVVKRGICYPNVCPSVRPSHLIVTSKRFKISKHVRQRDVLSFKFRSLKFGGSLGTSALNKDTP